MKKLIFIALLFLAGLAYSQTGEVKPSGAKILQTPNNTTFFFNQLDTGIWINMGAYGATKLARVNKNYPIWNHTGISNTGWGTGKLLGFNVDGNLIPVSATGGGIALTDLYGDSPISYNNTTGHFSMIANAYAPYSTVSFPGFGTSHVLAAYGDHSHSGVYQPVITTGTTAQYFRGDLSLATFPTSLPASDVYAWAKASTKPTYTYTEVGAQVAGSYAPVFTLTTTGTSGAATYTANVLNIPQYAGGGGIALTDLYGDSPISYNNTTGHFSMIANAYAPYGTVSFPGFGTSHSTAAYGDHNHSGVYAPVFTLTTTGTSGAATYSGNVLNIPQYAGGGMVYPGAGIPLSTGSAWGTSITNNSSNWNTAYSNMGKIYDGSGYALLNTAHFYTGAGYIGLQMGSISSGDVNPVSGGDVYTALAGISGADGNNYPTSLSFNYMTGDLTLARSGLTDLTTSLNNRFAIISGSSAQTWNCASLIMNGSLTGATTITASGIVTGSNFQLSDRRLKENIRPLHFKNRFDSILFYGFNLREDSLKRKRYGVIAQDVEKVAPELVYTDANGLKAVNYTELLVGKMARMEERIKELETRIKRLERHEK